MKPDIEIYFLDVTDTMKKQNRQLIQVVKNAKIMFMEQSSWQSHCKSSPGLTDGC